jgi:hypothetical protein
LLVPAVAQAQLISNGNFETDSNADGQPDNWPLPDGAKVVTENGNRFLRLTPPGEDKMLTVYRVVPVSADDEAFALSFRARPNDLVRGKANWHDGRIIVDFKDAEGKKLSGGPGHPSFKGTSDWVERRIDFLVPAGATQLEVMPALFMVKSGSLDLDDFVLERTDPAPIHERIRVAAEKKAAEIAERAAKVFPQVPVVPADKLPPTLRVVGNQIQTVDGKTIWLQGVSIPSMEWSGGGENILDSVREAIANWNVNVIRLPIKEDFWFGVGPWQRDGGAFYRQLVDDVINLGAAHGVYTVIDLHRYRAPTEVHARFWREFATKYKNHPAVLFELLNEPHDISWDVWKNGGFVSTEKTNSDALTENKEKLKGFESIGMQALLDAVRGTGAKNIAIVGGLDWSYDLSGILDGHAIDDRGGNGIVYSAHVYPWKSDWQGKFMDIAQKHPIFIGECGAPPERLEFIPPERHEDPSTWVPDFLGLVQKHKYNWTAWSFHPKASPVLLEDWDYTPTSYWGIHARDALNGKQFELKKLR